MPRNPPEAASPEKDRDTLAALFRSSLFDLARDGLDYRDMQEHTHRIMTDCLEDPGTRKLLCVPRGCFKSSIGVVSYSIWSLIRNPNLRILVDSEIFENSKNFIREMRGKLESPLMTYLYGPFRSGHWTEGSITIAQRTKVFKEASVTASGVGAGKTGQHYDLIIHDDLNSDKNSETHEQRQKVIRHYQMNVSILEPGGTMVVIGTRYASDDVIGWILEKECKGLLSGN